MSHFLKRAFVVVAILFASYLAFIPLRQGFVEAAAPTYSQEVSRIFQAKCQSCHHPGDIAPFSLMTYKDTKQWAGAIKSAVVAKRMPPWKPLAGCGDFKDVRQLSDAEIATVSQWVDAGAPEGNPADLPVALNFSDGWSLGEPDLIINADEDYAPPKDKDMYRCFTVPTALRGDRYISAIDVHPGNRKLVHHVITYTDPDGASKALDDKEPGPGYISFGGPGYTNYGMLGGWAPGARPFFNPDGVGMKLPKDSRVVFQVHYHPCQTATCGQSSPNDEKDRTQIGIYFSRTPIKKNLTYLPLVNQSFTIPAGNNRYKVSASFTVPIFTPAHIVNITPHMHLLGREISVDMTLPGKTTNDCLVNINDWDFRWQGTYSYQNPVALPGGSKVNLTTYFDNSSGNINNPNVPPKPVKWGEATTDEMALAFIGFTLDAESLPTSAPSLTEVNTDVNGNLVVKGTNLLPGADIEINGKSIKDTIEKSATELNSNEMWKVYAAPGKAVNVTIVNPDGSRTAAQSFTRSGTAFEGATVSAASYVANAPVAPEAIAAIFGANLATLSEPAIQLPLPTKLGGSIVKVNGVAAQLFYASKGQINFLIPKETQPGAAIIEVIAADNSVTRSALPITMATPALFTATSDGRGAPAANATPDGVIRYVVGKPDGTPNPVGIGHFLELYGTGFRRAAFDTLHVTIGGKEVPILYSGAHGFFTGVDQMNVQVPAGVLGNVDLVLSTDGKVANTVKLLVQ